MLLVMEMDWFGFDYKSNRLSYKDREADIERIKEEYQEQ